MKKFLVSLLAVAASVVAAQPTKPVPETLKAQLLLDRVNFSVGEIDGVMGSNTQRALRAFQRSRGLPETGTLDQGTRSHLGEDNLVLDTYVLTAEDVNQPLNKSTPTSMLGKSKLERLHFTSLAEAIAEKFHMSPRLLKQLNPNIKFAAGEQIVVPLLQAPSQAKAARIVVTKHNESLVVYDANNELIAYFPTTLGSAANPPPYGELEVLDVSRNPSYNYDPTLFEDPGTPIKVVVKPGPNNPVGLVWIDLSREHYGIHGTPEPSKIGKTQSHGCIRLTNWDALELAGMVSPGVKVIIRR